MRSVAILFVLAMAAPVSAQVDCDAARDEAARLHAERDYRGAAAAYVRMARETPECGYLDQVLYNAAVDYEAARLVGRAIQVRNVLLANFPDSPLASRAVYLIAGNYHSLAIYENAATWYERFARDYPGATLPLRQLVDESGALRDVCVDEERADPGRCAVARWALENAVFFRRSLGDAEGASAAAALYVDAYRTTFPEDTASVVFSTRPEVHDDEPIEDPAAVEAFLSAFLADYGSVLRLDQETRARVDLARAQLALDRRPDAERELDRLIALFPAEAFCALFGRGLAVVL
jgi:hypothetical protein